MCDNYKVSLYKKYKYEVYAAKSFNSTQIFMHTNNFV